jgi:hypothetical protein
MRHLQVRPSIVRPGNKARVFWNVSNVESCSVSGTNGDSWIGIASGALGTATSPIMGRTTFTLHCDANDGAFAAEHQRERECFHYADVDGDLSGHTVIGRSNPQSHLVLPTLPLALLSASRATVYDCKRSDGSKRCVSANTNSPSG